jgi:hypothetical protein
VQYTDIKKELDDMQHEGLSLSRVAPSPYPPLDEFESLEHGSVSSLLSEARIELTKTL